MVYKRGVRFGMRLFTVSVHPGHSPGSISFSTAGILVKDGTIVDDIVAIAKKHLDVRRFGDIRLRHFESATQSPQPEDEPEVKTEPAIKVTSAELHGNLVRFTFNFGRTGTADEGMGRDSDDDVPLMGRAPSNQYIATFFPPRGEGSGLLAVEVRSRICAGDHLCKLLS